MGEKYMLGKLVIKRKTWCVYSIRSNENVDTDGDAHIHIQTGVLSKWHERSFWNNHIYIQIQIWRMYMRKLTYVNIKQWGLRRNETLKGSKTMEISRLKNNLIHIFKRLKSEDVLDVSVYDYVWACGSVAWSSLQNHYHLAVNVHLSTGVEVQLLLQFYSSLRQVVFFKNKSTKTSTEMWSPASDKRFLSAGGCLQAPVPC